MVMKRKMRRPRAPAAKRYKRGAVRARVPRRNLMPKLSCKRTFWFENWQPSTVATVNFWKYYNFGFSQLPTAAEFVALFDQYRISAIKVTFRPRFDNFAGNNTTDVTPPGVTAQQGSYLSIINDPRSTIVPTGTYNSANYNIFCEQGNVKTYQGTRPISVYFKPIIREAGAGGAIISRRPPFFSTTVTTEPHYGFHAFAHDGNFSGTFGNSWDVFVTYYMMFKNLR